MILNRIELGTKCTIRKSGEIGKVNKIFFYPTKFEIEFIDGRIEHYSSKDLEFEGLEQPSVTLKLPTIPQNGIGKSWSNWSPFKSESYSEHHFSTSKEIMWGMLTALEMYNVWFHGIQRALPVVITERYVHKYSFTKLDLKPGAYFKIRPIWETYYNEFKEQVIRQIITFIDESLSYNPSSRITQDEFEECGIYRTHIDRYTGDDFVWLYERLLP